MNDHLDENDLFDAIEATGNAFGFVLAEVMLNPNPSSPTQHVRTLAGTLHDLSTSDRFSPNVSIAINGIVSGLLARINKPADPLI